MRRMARKQYDWVNAWRIAFEMTLEEWKRYHDLHPLAKKEHHHIIQTEKEPPKVETDVMRFIKKLKEKHPDILKKDAEEHVRSFIQHQREKQEHPNHVRLTSDELKHSLGKGHFTIISAGPNTKIPEEKAMSPNDSFFAERSKKLQADLDAMNVPYTSSVGHYGGEEHSFMVFHDDEYADPDLSKAPNNTSNYMVHYTKKQADGLRQKLNELGKKYNQDSVLHAAEGKNTIRFTSGAQEGKECGGSGWEEKPEAEDFFTQVETYGRENTKFALDISECFEKGML